MLGSGKLIQNAIDDFVLVSWVSVCPGYTTRLMIVTGISKYSGEMAERLAAQGHEVRVVTAPPYYPQWRVADPSCAGMESRLSCER